MIYELFKLSAQLNRKNAWLYINIVIKYFICDH